MWLEGLGELKNPVTSSGMDSDPSACNIVPQATSVTSCTLTKSYVYTFMFVLQLLSVNLPYRQSLHSMRQVSWPFSLA
jgi:hypothetical protein